jgi:hypothetical protein
MPWMPPGTPAWRLRDIQQRPGPRDTTYRVRRQSPAAVRKRRKKQLCRGIAVDKKPVSPGGLTGCYASKSIS